MLTNREKFSLVVILCLILFVAIIFQWQDDTISNLMTGGFFALLYWMQRTPPIPEDPEFIEWKQKRKQFPTQFPPPYPNHSNRERAQEIWGDIIDAYRVMTYTPAKGNENLIQQKYLEIRDLIIEYLNQIEKDSGGNLDDTF